MKYVYPAVFTKEENQYLVTVPDLKGCHTFGNSLTEAIEMAEDATAMWLCLAEDNKEDIPDPSELEAVQGGEGFVNLVLADTNEYRRLNDGKAVKKTLSIPSWLNKKAEREGVNFSQILQDALKAKLR